MIRILKRVILIFVVMGVAGCGGGTRVELAGSANCDEDSCGTLKLMVKGAQPSSLTSTHAQLKTFRVAVSGPGIEGELVGEFSADAAEGLIEGVPAGDDRQVEVSAININSQTIREGEAEDISVKGGATSDVDVTLEAVPIFVNLKDGSTVENTRLVFHVFSDSQGQAVIEDETAAGSEVLVSASTSLPDVSFDVSTGLGRFAPALIQPDDHKFTVRDASTGRSSAVSIYLLDGSKRKPAPLFSGSEVGSTASGPSRNLGQLGLSPVILDTAK
jgi:hypothetical protein